MISSNLVALSVPWRYLNVYSSVHSLTPLSFFGFLSSLSNSFLAFCFRRTLAIRCTVVPPLRWWMWWGPPWFPPLDTQVPLRGFPSRLMFPIWMLPMSMYLTNYLSLLIHLFANWIIVMGSGLVCEMQVLVYEWIIFGLSSLDVCHVALNWVSWECCEKNISLVCIRGKESGRDVGFEFPRFSCWNALFWPNMLLKFWTWPP